MRWRVAEARFSYKHGQLRRCLQCGALLTSMLWDYRREDARYYSALPSARPPRSPANAVPTCRGVIPSPALMLAPGEC
jgi:hypothetical protein